jgi:hypothetical protein
MSRTKRLRPDAEQVAFYLTPQEQLVLQVIRVRRKERGEERISQSEIVADSLITQLEKVEGVARKEIEKLVTDDRATSSKVNRSSQK